MGKWIAGDHVQLSKRNARVYVTRERLNNGTFGSWLSKSQIILDPKQKKFNKYHIGIYYIMNNKLKKIFITFKNLNAIK